MPSFRCRSAAAAILLALSSAVPGSAQLASRLSDFEPGASGQLGTAPEIVGPASSGFVYSAEVSSFGRELWTAVGDPPQPQLLIDFCPGLQSAQFFPIGAIHGLQLVFAHSECGYSNRMASVLVTDGSPGSVGQLLSEFDFSNWTFPDFAGTMPRRTEKLVFFVRPAGQGSMLIATDGTPAGTETIRTFDTFPGPLAGAGYLHYFVAPHSGGVGGSELWRTDSTAEGTFQIAIFPGSTTVEPISNSGPFLYFKVYGEDSGGQLWRTDGSSGGTLALNTFPGLYSGVIHLETEGTRAFFLAYDSSFGNEIWTSDGSVAGTHAVTDFGPEEPFLLPFFGLAEEFMAVQDGKVYFNAADGVAPRALWIAGIEPGSARRFAEYCPSETSCYSPVEVEVVGDTIVYFAVDTEHGLEPRYVHGLAENARLLVDTCPGPCSNASGFEFSAGPYLALDAYPDLWITDGTPAGTTLLTQEYLNGPRPASNSRGQGEYAEPLLFFEGYDERHGSNLWYAEPAWTPSIIGPIPDPSEWGDGPRGLEAAGLDLFLTAESGYHTALYIILQGEAAPSTIEGDFYFCHPDGPGFAEDIGNALLFTDCDGTTLYRSSRNGQTEILAELPAPIEDSARLGGKLVLLLAPVYPDHSGEIWTTDGTIAGTVLTLALDEDARATDIASADGYVLLQTTDFEGSHLWKLSNNGTALQPVLHLPPSSYFAGDIEPVGAFAYLSVFVPHVGIRLWISDGTPEGTVELATLGTSPVTAAGSLGDRDVILAGGGFVLVTDRTPSGTSGIAYLESGPAGTNSPRKALVFAGKFYFSVVGTDRVLRLFATNGTIEGTHYVADLAPPGNYAGTAPLVATPEALFFPAWSPASGLELWTLEAGAQSVRLVHDIAPGPASSLPEELTLAGSRLYFTANDGVNGREVWAIELGGLSQCQSATDTLCLAEGRFRVEANWRDFTGSQGHASAVPISDDTGYFWFFDDANVEMILKVIDGQGFNGHQWVFYGALSNVEYSVTVTDSVTGAARRYFNPAGRFAAAGDILAFGPQGAHARGSIVEVPARAGTPPAVSTPSPLSGAGASGSCFPSATRFCILGNRFSVEARWEDFDGDEGVAYGATLTDDTGYLWFFDEANVEVVVKAVDGMGYNGRFWIFYGALTNVEYTLEVTDTVTGVRREYRNALGSFGSFGDIDAFPGP